MHITLSQQLSSSIDHAIWLLPVSPEKPFLPASLAALAPALADEVAAVLTSQPKLADYGTTTLLYLGSEQPTRPLLLIGTGDSQDITLPKLRSLAATAVRSLQPTTFSTAVSLLAELPLPFYSLEDKLAALAEGSQLGTYAFQYYKQEAKNAPPALTELHIYSSQPLATKVARSAILRGSQLAESITLARDLVNHPGNYLTPAKLIEVAKDIAATTPELRLTILTETDLQAKSMGALLAVGQGSAQRPVLLALEYTGNPASQEKTALIGKGITFDSGGISLKPSDKMGEMKTDMAGAATVLAAMQLLARRKPAANILGVIPCAENLPSSTAYRPGDVITAMNGTTIEIITTDAEGRLILADAITYAKEQQATRIIDFATLTGACLVALGTVTSGVISNNTPFTKEFLAAAKQSGEKMWVLPADAAYKEQIKSDIADLKNSGGRMAGTITAGLFLGEFAGTTPWIHVDIAGTATTDKTVGDMVKGATGVGIRTLASLFAPGTTI